jgi:hypothetical protein
LPDELPLGARGDNPGDGGNRHLFSRRGLRKVTLPSGLSLLSNSNLT